MDSYHACQARYFYPRPPRGGRPAKGAYCAVPGGISIHALREEGDSFAEFERLPSGISIHALREEGDAIIPVLAL